MAYDPQNPDAKRQIDPYTGYAPRHQMEGFAYDRLQDPEKSAKDAFAYYSNQAPPPPTDNKDALAVWFKTYIQPGMQQLGHNVTDVQGDKFRFNNWQGDFWVDYGRGAGAPGGALSWQADYAQGGPGNQAYNQTQQAIMGVPRPTNSPPISQAVLGQPAETADLSAYYQYLQSLLQTEQI